MKLKHLLICIALLLPALTVHGQSSVRVQPNNAFTFGEKITYKVRYNLYFNLNVGEVDFEIDKKPETVAGNTCFHIEATGKTYSFYDKVYRIRDRYESYLEVQSILPLVFIRDVQEGKFKFNEYVLFNQSRHMAKSKKRTQSVPQFTQDVVSAIYYARTIDYKNAKPGQNFFVHAFIDDSAYKCGVKFVKREDVKTDLGTFHCIKLKPLLIVDRMFKSSEDMTLWVTDDENHIPVRIESGISVGTIQADLASYSGLKNPLVAKQ